MRRPPAPMRSLRPGRSGLLVGGGRGRAAPGATRWALHAAVAGAARAAPTRDAIRAAGSDAANTSGSPGSTRRRVERAGDLLQVRTVQTIDRKPQTALAIRAGA